MREGWELSTIGDVCRIVNGGTPKTTVAKFWDGSHSWITPAEMGGRDSPYVGATRRTLSDEGLAHCSASLLPAFSVILSSRAPIGHLVINEVPMATNQGCKGLAPDNRLNHKFLYYYLLGKIELLRSLGFGTTFPELSAARLKTVPIPLPPLPDQKRIVAILDEAFEGIDTAIANTERNLANARALFESAVNTKVFSAAVQADWATTVVSDVAAGKKGAIRTGPFGSQLLHSEFVGEGIAVLGIDNVVANEFRWGKERFITPEKFEKLARYEVAPGDVLISIMGTCGRCAIVPENIPVSINTKHLCCISLNRDMCLPEFLRAHFLYNPLARSYLASRSKGAIMDGLNMGIIKELPLKLPSIDVQLRIVGEIESLAGAVMSLEAAFRKKCDLLAQLKVSLLHKTLRGELTATPQAEINETAAQAVA